MTPGTYPWLNNSDAETFWMVTQGYVFGNHRANHNHGIVVRHTALAFGVQAHWDECVAFVVRHWDTIR